MCGGEGGRWESKPVTFPPMGTCGAGRAGGGKVNQLHSRPWEICLCVNRKCTQLLLNLNLELLVSTCDSDHTLMYVFSSFCSSLMLSLTCPLPCQVFIFFICTQQASRLCTHFNAHLFASLGATQP